MGLSISGNNPHIIAFSGRTAVAASPLGPINAFPINALLTGMGEPT